MKNIQRENKLNQAAYELSDDIWPIRDKLEKVNLLMGDVLDEFFRAYDPEKERDLNFIRYTFKRFNLLTDISQKLIWEAFKDIEALEKRADIVIDAKIKERGSDDEAV